MKTLLVSALALTLVCGAVFAQNNPAKTSKAKPAAVDCSRTTDAQINDGVKAKLAGTSTLKDDAINVVTNGGVVTLTGSVKKGNHKGLASLQARRVSCVQKVDNQITVEGSAQNKSGSKKKSMGS